MENSWVSFIYTFILNIDVFLDSVNRFSNCTVIEICKPSKV